MQMVEAVARGEIMHRTLKHKDHKKSDNVQNKEIVQDVVALIPVDVEEVTVHHGMAGIRWFFCLNLNQ